MIDLHRVGVSPAAIEGYRRYFPGATGRDVLAAIPRGVELTYAEARDLLRRRANFPTPDAYVLDAQRVGIFVVAPARSGRAMSGYVVTYLRIQQPEQFQEACVRWPGREPLTAAVPWVLDAAGRVAPPYPARTLAGVLGGPVTRREGPAWPGGVTAADESIAAGRYRWASDGALAVTLADGSTLTVRIQQGERSTNRVARWFPAE